MTEDGGTAPLPGTTVVAPASAILMTLASSTLFMTIGAKAMLHGAPPRLHQDHFWIDLEEEIHRDSDKRLRKKSKSGHEERDLAFQKCLVAGMIGREFDAMDLSEF